ncbi:MAG TPA: ThuA domain-containing protein, partial [Candidatus Acidoferrales bacterium]|nr:ThuA domain-containing protein [Candidatus Acidoferrales bacterium]
MKHIFAVAILLALAIGPTNLSATDQPKAFSVLVFSKTTGYRHASITNGIATIRELGAKNDFSVDATEDSSVFSPTNLARYQAVIFLSVTGEVLDSKQKRAFENYIEDGGGLAAIHGSIFGPLACEDKWAWYGAMFCCAFTNHSRVLPATVKIEDRENPSTMDMPGKWQRTDEWYNFTGTPRGCTRVLATVDESTYTGGEMGPDHPIAWCRRVGRGRMWYTAMGHTESSYAEPLFQKHLLGGILIAAGKTPADFEPNPRPPANLDWKRTRTSLALLNGTNIIWQIVADPAQGKPYFHPLATPEGTLLSD